MKALDFIIRIKNAARAQRKEFVVPYSKLCLEIGKVLVGEGFLEEVRQMREGNSKKLSVKLAYEKRTPRFSDTLIISKPSLKKQIGKNQIKDLEKRGNKTLILSTSQGVMTGKQAQKKKIGGEILFAIW